MDIHINNDINININMDITIHQTHYLKHKI